MIVTNRKHYTLKSIFSKLKIHILIFAGVVEHSVTVALYTTAMALSPDINKPTLHKLYKSNYVCKANVILHLEHGCRKSQEIGCRQNNKQTLKKQSQTAWEH